LKNNANFNTRACTPRRVALMPCRPYAACGDARRACNEVCSMICARLANAGPIFSFGTHA
jgi:hypothetical protein